MSSEGNSSHKGTEDASAVSSDFSLLQTDEELYAFIEKEITRRNKFNQSILRYVTDRDSKRRSLQDLLDKLKSSDKLTQSLLDHLVVVQKREKDENDAGRDSGLGHSTVDTRRYGVHVTETALAELTSRASINSFGPQAIAYGRRTPVPSEHNEGKPDD